MKTWTLLEFFRKEALENVFKKEEKNVILLNEHLKMYIKLQMAVVGCLKYICIAKNDFCSLLNTRTNGERSETFRESI